ncbi:MAG: hypothetical protein QOD06_1273 [Candidatus Binatota bacterium]|nr:hypothetical protein [Candidatus Binatota bacterium]
MKRSWPRSLAAAGGACLCLVVATATTGCSTTSEKPISGSAVGPSVRARSQIVEDLYDTEFVTPDLGWAVGVFGSVYRTDDGGRHWKMQPTPTTEHLFSVVFTDERTGWACGRQGVVLHTEDGGGAWTLQQSGTDKHLFAIEFAGVSNGWAVGDWGVRIQTSDGGRTWQDRSLAEDKILYDVDFADRDTGWIVGEFGTILYTADGGHNWVPQSAGTDKTFFGVAPASPDRVFIVGIDGLLLRTVDRGATWQLKHGQVAATGVEQMGFLDVLQNPGFYDVEVRGAHGAVVGDIGSVMITEDGGETWTDSPLPPDRRLQWIRGVSLPSAGRGMIVGAAGLTFAIEGRKLRFSQEPPA